MNRILLLTLVALVLAFATAGLAAADGGPHGGYTATSDACAGCHRAHTAQAAKLLVVAEGDLCMSCHGSSATGADTNVEDGVYAAWRNPGTGLIEDQPDRVPGDPAEGTPRLGLKGGGFEYTLMNTELISDTDYTLSPKAVTSWHTYDNSLGKVWGNGDPISPTVSGEDAYGGLQITMSCTNCHDPHGNGNYRILRPVPLGPAESDVAGPVTVTDEADKNCTIESVSGFYFGEGYEQARDLGFAIVPIRQEYQDVSYASYQHLAEELEPYNTESFQVIFRLNTMTKWDQGERDYERCLALPFWSYIDAGGNVWGCSVFMERDEFHYGNIYENTFQEIWEGPKRAESLQWFAQEFDPCHCRINCRMDEINRYLWELKHPPAHVNFI